MELVAVIAGALVAAVDVVTLMGTASVPFLALVNVRASAFVAEQEPPLRAAAFVAAHQVAALVRTLPVPNLALVDVPFAAVARPAIFANTAKQIRITSSPSAQCLSEVILFFEE